MGSFPKQEKAEKILLKTHVASCGLFYTSGGWGKQHWKKKLWMSHYMLCKWINYNINAHVAGDQKQILASMRAVG